MTLLILAVVVSLSSSISFVPSQTTVGWPAPPIEDLRQELNEREDAGLLSDADRRLVDQLSVLPVSIDIERVAISDLVPHINKSVGAPIRVDWDFLSKCGISADSRLGFTIRNRTAFDAVNQLVDWMNEQSTQLVRWTVWEGEVVIGFTQDLRPRTTLIVYDVRDLIQEDGAEARQAQVNQIISLIQQNVFPNTWRALGGKTGSIEALNGNLIVTQTMPNHRAIEELLTELRAAAAVQILVDTTVVMSDRTLADLDLDLPAPVDAEAPAGLHLVDDEARAAVLESILQHRDTRTVSSPRVLIRNGGHATIDITNGVVVTLPVIGEPETTAPVQLLDGIATNVDARMDQTREWISVGMTVRTSNIDLDNPAPRQREGLTSFDLTLAEGQLAVIEVPTTLYELIGVRRSTDRMTDSQTLEVLREEIDAERKQTILLLLQTRIAVPERQEG